MNRIKTTHTEHCCLRHGCKYAVPGCPVATGRVYQSFMCEQCDWELGEGGGLDDAYLMNEMYTKGYERGYDDGIFNGSGGEMK